MADLSEPDIREARTESIVAGILTGVTDVNGAKELSNDDGLLFRQANGQYQSAQNNLEAITKDSIGQIGITIDGETRYFKKIDQVTPDQSPTGFRAIAWQETNAGGEPLGSEKGDLWLCYPGFCGDPFNMKSPETQSLHAVGDGKLSPQVTEVPAFVERVLGKIDREDIAAINIGAHSLGAANALTSQLVLDIEGIPAQTTLILEPAGAKLAEEKIETALRDPNSTLTKIILEPNQVSPEDAIAKLRDSSREKGEELLSIRMAAFNQKGDPQFTHTAMLEPGAPRFKNTMTGVKGREGPVAHANEMVGEDLYVDITANRDVIPKIPGALPNPDTHHRLGNVVAALREDKVADTISQLKEAGQTLLAAGVTGNTASVKETHHGLAENNAPSKDAPLSR